MSFERYTDRARRVIVLAQEEARLLKSELIEPEHILCGLIHESEGLAAVLLASLSIQLESIRGRLNSDSGFKHESGINFSDASKAILQAIPDIADGLNHVQIGTEHIFLGVTGCFEDAENTACRILSLLGWDQEKLHGKMLLLMDQFNKTSTQNCFVSRERQIRECLGRSHTPMTELRAEIDSMYGLHPEIQKSAVLAYLDAIAQAIQEATLLTVANQ
jgi:ATP-dependent Clp protease ATP-binding subunit ClpA